jgi:DNA-binding transcriptional regulator YdaS (Cro superfamily)
MDNLMDLHVKISKLQTQRKELMKKKLYSHTQKWLCEVTGIKPSRLNAWINSVNELNSEEIKRINDALG